MSLVTSLNADLDDKLPGLIKLPSGTDPQTVTQVGFYTVNAPPIPGMSSNNYLDFIYFSTDGNKKFGEIFGFSREIIYISNKVNDIWSQWYKIIPS